MSGWERQLGVIKDVLLPVDMPTRYDLYFTDKRIAIVCMGHSRRVDYEAGEQRSFLFGVAPEATQHPEDEKVNKQKIEDEINALSLDEKLKLSKKSCFYTYEEIEEAKLISGKKPKFVILSKECISKFSPNLEQFRQLLDLLPTIEKLKHKTSVNVNLELKPQLGESPVFGCKYCGAKNDVDAVFCEGCGKKIEAEVELLACGSCGAKNRVQAMFCKKCGVPLLK